MGNVKVYPNPCTDLINVTLDHANENATYMLYDLSGNSVNTQYSRQNQSLIINTLGLPNGFYFLSVSTDNSIQHIKILKTN
ncbi:MAG: T9SS type A sorting domain-containing protein [Bacteroidetes bacterium]|nr:T9SS type A sorting domain-containing protein [Bacteroidota bacterium]